MPTLAHDAAHAAHISGFTDIQPMCEQLLACSVVAMAPCFVVHRFHIRPVGPLDKASATGAVDSRFESWVGQPVVAGAYTCNVYMQCTHVIYTCIIHM